MCPRLFRWDSPVSSALLVLNSLPGHGGERSDCRCPPARAAKARVASGAVGDRQPSRACLHGAAAGLRSDLHSVRGDVAESIPLPPRGRGRVGAASAGCGHIDTVLGGQPYLGDGGSDTVIRAALTGKARRPLRFDTCGVRQSERVSGVGFDVDTRVADLL